MSTFIINAFSIAPAKATHVYEGRDTTASASGTVLSFLASPFGTEDANRVIKIIVFWAATGASATITEGSGTTIGGVEASVDHQHVSSAVDAFDTRYYVGIISAPVPTGTSGDVQITFGASASNVAEIHIYSVRDLLESDPISTGEFLNLPGSDTVVVENGGVALFGVASRNASDPYTLTGVDEDYDENWIPNARIAAGSQAINANHASYSIQATDTDGIGTGVGVMASYR